MLVLKLNTFITMMQSRFSEMLFSNSNKWHLVDSSLPREKTSLFKHFYVTSKLLLHLRFSLKSKEKNK